MTNIRNSARKSTPARSQSSVSRRTNLARKHSGNGNGLTASKNGNGHRRPVESVGNGHSETVSVQTANVSQRDQLLQERNHVLAELNRLRAELLEAPERTGDEVDLSVYDREKTLGLVKAFERRLEKIDTALQASEKGQYGICLTCGQPIDEERLKIFPETRHCVKCKIKAEQQDRRRLLGYK